MTPLKLSAVGFPPPRAPMVLALCVFYLGLWMVATPYFGLHHDAQAYAGAALVTLDPQPLAGDLFFRYRSQDDFSVFPQIYAVFISAVGLERAAALLCFTFHMAWYGLAAAIAARVLGANVGLLSLGLLIAMPAPYGGLKVFHLVEPFLTARLPAEVLSLLAIWLFLAGRRYWCVIVLLAALMVHPLMAFPAALLVALLWLQQVGGRSALPLCAVAILAGAIAGSWLLGGSSPTMEGQWLALTRIRSSFLFLDGWQALDWSQTFQPLITLLLATGVLHGTSAGKVSAATLWLSAVGLALAAYATWVSPLDLLVQGQPWRWLWPSRLFAVMLLPAVLFALWRGPGAERAAALFIAAGWLVFIDPGNASRFAQFSPSVLMACGLVIWLVRSRIAERASRLLVAGGVVAATAVLAAASIRGVVSVIHASGAVETVDWFDYLRSVANTIVPMVAAVALAWTVAMRAFAPGRAALFGIAAAVLAATLAPRTFSEWNRQNFGVAAKAYFADWRALIPLEAEVLWDDNLQDTWFLLNRRSYLSRSQSGGVAFSRELAAEIVRRALVLQPIVDRGFWILDPAARLTRPYPLSRQALATICQDPDLGFVVSSEDVGGSIARKHWRSQHGALMLYSCADLRGPKA